MTNPLEFRFGNTIVNVRTALARDLIYLKGLLTLYNVARREMNRTMINPIDETPECYRMGNELEREMGYVGERIVAFASIHNQLSQGGTA